MQDDDRLRPNVEARAWLAREEEAAARCRFEAQQRGPVDELEAACAWVDQLNAIAPKQKSNPAPQPKPPALVTMTKAQVEEIVRAAISRERASMQAHLQAIVEIVGEETGKADKAVLDKLRGEIEQLRAERCGDAVIELPDDWRSHAH